MNAVRTRAVNVLLPVDSVEFNRHPINLTQALPVDSVEFNRQSIVKCLFECSPNAEL